MSAVAKLMPELNEKGIKYYIDIMLKRFGKKSGKVVVNSTTKNAAGQNIAEGTVTAVANSAGARIAVKGNSSAINSAVNVDATKLATRRPTETLSRDVVKNINYTEADGIGSLSISRMSGNGISVEGSVSANKSFWDGMTKIQTEGAYNSFGEMLAKAKSQL